MRRWIARRNARSFGLKLKSILGEARQPWRDQRAGKANRFQAEVERMEKELSWHLRPRRLKEEDHGGWRESVCSMIGEGAAVPARSRRSNQPTIGAADSASKPCVRR